MRPTPAGRISLKMLFARMARRPREKDHSGLGGGIVIGKAGAIGSTALHQRGQPSAVGLSFSRVGIRDLEAEMEDTLTLGVQVDALWRWIHVGLAQLELNVREIADPILHGQEAFAVGNFQLFVLSERRIRFPRANSDRFVVCLRLVDIVYDNANVVQFLRDVRHLITPYPA